MHDAKPPFETGFWPGLQVGATVAVVVGADAFAVGDVVIAEGVAVGVVGGDVGVGGGQNGF